MAATVAIPVGDVLVTVPAGGRYGIEYDQGRRQVTIRPKDARSAQLLREVAPTVSRNHLAARLGMSLADKPAEPAMVQPRKPKNGKAVKADRPRQLTTMIGQETARLRLLTRVKGCRRNGKVIGPVLFYGPPGVGKTTLARMVVDAANGNEERIANGERPIGKTVTAMGRNLSMPERLREELDKLSHDEIDVFFIDEIHRMRPQIQELLYPAMEDGTICLPVAGNSGGRKVTKEIELPEFILVGATTQLGKLEEPMQDRFSGGRYELTHYTVDECVQIIERRAEGHTVRGEPAPIKIEPEATLAIAQRSRGTARVACDLFDTVWNYTTELADSGDVPITMDSAGFAFDIEEIDSMGLDKSHRRVIETICKTYRGGPIGAKPLAASCGIEVSDLEDLELFLLRAGLVEHSGRGRKATRLAFDHLGLPIPNTLDVDSEM